MQYCQIEYFQIEYCQIEYCQIDTMEGNECTCAAARGGGEMIYRRILKAGSIYWTAVKFEETISIQRPPFSNCLHRACTCIPEPVLLLLLQIVCTEPVPLLLFRACTAALVPWLYWASMP